MNLFFVILVDDVVKHVVLVRVDVTNRLVGLIHVEAAKVLFGQRAPVGQPPGHEDVLDEEVGQLEALLIRVRAHQGNEESCPLKVIWIKIIHERRQKS